MTTAKTEAAPAPKEEPKPYRIPNPKLRSEMVRVRDAKTGDILPNRVPRQWLKTFPQLKEVPSEKKGK